MGDPTSGILGLTPLGAVTTGLSVAGQVFGAIKGAKQAKKNQALIHKKQVENESDYNLNGQRSFLETNAAKDAVKSQNEALVDAQKNVAGRAAITGASDEAVVASNTGVQKNYSDAISRLAGAGTQYQDNQKRMYLSRKDSLDGQQMQLNQQKADGAANLSGNAGDLMNSLPFAEGMNSQNTPKSGVSEVLKQRTPLQTSSLNKIAKSAYNN